MTSGNVDTLTGSTPAEAAGERGAEGETAPDGARRPLGLDDYSGEFVADFRYEDLSKEALVRLVREYAQAVHILDRSMCAAIGMAHGIEEMERLAIEEWRGASPVYGGRLRRAMGVEGDDVEAIFKVLQLDPGFPHHYLDVRYEVVDARHGFFELAYCGALMDAEPWGDTMVTGMCHHIEDGTFDVTAQAINPKAHIRHVHRPPRVPGDRSPHCRWELVIDDDNETLPEADITKVTRMTTAATFEFPPMLDGTPHIPPRRAAAGAATPVAGEAMALRPARPVRP